ncbi:LPP20 family lipoprotein [Halorhodospira neutriphila]|nr:LPP20 family lipoprotein [Halorhodospira neutriphila]
MICVRLLMALLALAVLILSGCAVNGISEPSSANEASSSSGSGDGPPPWVTSPPKKKGVVYGVGSAEIHVDAASAINRAQDRARTELVKRLEVTISGETTATRSREVEDGQSRVTRSVMESVKSQVSETELANIEIVKTYAAEGGGVAYALARLNRDQAESDLIAKIEDLDARIREILEQDPGESANRLARLEVLMPALPLLAQRKQSVEKLQLVAERDPGYRRPSEFRDLADRIASILDSLTVVLRSKESGFDRQMASMLRQTLVKQGVKVREGGSGDLTLRYEASLRAVERDDRSFVFADGNVTVLDGVGNAIDEFQERVKAGSVDPDLARDRAVGRLAEGLGSKLGESLLDSFQRAGVR